VIVAFNSPDDQAAFEADRKREEETSCGVGAGRRQRDASGRAFVEGVDAAEHQAIAAPPGLEMTWVHVAAGSTATQLDEDWEATALAASDRGEDPEVLDELDIRPGGV
jgi:hypothetical protein